MMIRRSLALNLIAAFLFPGGLEARAGPLTRRPWGTAPVAQAGGVSSDRREARQDAPGMHSQPTEPGAETRPTASMVISATLVTQAGKAPDPAALGDGFEVGSDGRIRVIALLYDGSVPLALGRLGPALHVHRKFNRLIHGLALSLVPTICRLCARCQASAPCTPTPGWRPA